METLVIDTNCLISFVSDRNLAQQEKIAAVFHEAGRLRIRLICHHHVVSEFVYVLTGVYGIDPARVREMISDLMVMPGVAFASEVKMQDLLALWPEEITDYGDAVLAAYCRRTRGTRVVTFDRKFSNQLTRTGIPGELL